MDYQQGKIYRIYSPSQADVGVYYGSTVCKLCKRLSGHKTQKDCSSRPIIEIGDAVIELVEDFPCNSLKELETREYWFIQNNECINKNKGICDYTEYKKKYREKNREEIKEYQKEYREKNKEQIKEYREKNREEIKEFFIKNREEYNRRRREKYAKAKQTSETVVQALSEE
jgi:serine/threonine protein phosphatase PrpC